MMGFPQTRHPSPEPGSRFLVGGKAGPRLKAGVTMLIDHTIFSLLPVAVTAPC